MPGPPDGTARCRTPVLRLLWGLLIILPAEHYAPRFTDEETEAVKAEGLVQRPKPLRERSGSLWPGIACTRAPSAVRARRPVSVQQPVLTCRAPEPGGRRGPGVLV